MNAKSLDAAIENAQRFLTEALAVQATYSPDHGWIMAGPKETGSLRRRSLDLTRSLAEMRKP